jgi:mono/diheme cytochrome c family protein
LAHLAVIALCMSAVVPVLLESRASAYYEAALDGRRQAPAPQDAVQPGQEDFDRVCKVCHGAEARGDAGPRLVPFTREYEELLGIVREGSGQMPPIAARELPDEGVMRIFAYLKQLSRARGQEPQRVAASGR